MAAVQENMAKLTGEDRDAIAAYLKALPPRPDAVPKSTEEKKPDADAGGASGDEPASGAGGKEPGGSDD